MTAISTIVNITIIIVITGIVVMSYLWRQGRPRLPVIHLGGRRQCRRAGCGPPAPAGKCRTPRPTAATSHQSWQCPHGGPGGGTPPAPASLHAPEGR